MKHQVKVSEVPSGDLLSTESDDSPQFISLRQVIDRFGGYEFELELADGTMVPGSLEEYRGRDPDATYLRIEVESTPESEQDAADFDARAETRQGEEPL
jgi:hypothetical protein